MLTENSGKQTWEIAYETWLNNKALDENSRKELLLLKEKTGEIQDRFARELEFGTGGLRGVIGAGTNRMNRYVIRRTTQGLANYLHEQYPQLDKKIAIAYDSRYHSREFAEETARLRQETALKPFFSEMRPTPQLSFAVRELGCQAGVVITASHNPPEYNGYKVYGEDGGQATGDLASTLSAKLNKWTVFRMFALSPKRKRWKKICGNLLKKILTVSTWKRSKPSFLIPPMKI